MTQAGEARITLDGSYVTDGGETVGAGSYVARREDGKVLLTGEASDVAARAVETLRLSPTDFEAGRVTVHDVTIGIEFHWQRTEAQQFQGALVMKATNEGLTIINELPLEAYLVSVISSEMSAACPPELLRAHAVVSRSWLLAQLARAGEPSNDSGIEDQSGAAQKPNTDEGAGDAPLEIIRWYGRENHSDFDVCADDHCQRYQGISKAFSPEAFQAVRDTRGG